MFTPSPAFTAVFVSSTISWVSCWMADPKSLNSLPQSVSVALWTISLVDFWTFVASSLAMSNHEKEEVGSPRVPVPPWPEEPPSSSSTGSSLGARNALNMAPPSTSDPLNTRLLLPRPLVETDFSWRSYSFAEFGFGETDACESAQAKRDKGTGVRAGRRRW